MFVVFLLFHYCFGQDRGGSAPGYAFDLSNILGRAQLSGSLEYWGVCDWNNFIPDLPKIHPGSEKEKSAVDRIRAMFAVDNMMRVTQGRDGKIRMVETDVPDDLRIALGIEDK
jgi:hypothetical protein